MRFGENSMIKQIMYICINKASLCNSISCLRTNSNCEPIGVWQQLNIIIYQAFFNALLVPVQTFLNQKVENNSSCMLFLKKQFLLPMTSMKTSLSDSTAQTCDLQSGTLRSRSINWVFKNSSAVSQQPSCHKYCIALTCLSLVVMQRLLAICTQS